MLVKVYWYRSPYIYSVAGIQSPKGARLIWGSSIQNEEAFHNPWKQDESTIWKAFCYNLFQPSSCATSTRYCGRMCAPVPLSQFLVSKRRALHTHPIHILDIYVQFRCYALYAISTLQRLLFSPCGSTNPMTLVLLSCRCKASRCRLHSGFVTLLSSYRFAWTCSFYAFSDDGEMGLILIIVSWFRPFAALCMAASWHVETTFADFSRSNRCI